MSYEEISSLLRVVRVLRRALRPWIACANDNYRYAFRHLSNLCSNVWTSLSEWRYEKLFTMFYRYFVLQILYNIQELCPIFFLKTFWNFSNLLGFPKENGFLQNRCDVAKTAIISTWCACVKLRKLWKLFFSFYHKSDTVFKHCAQYFLLKTFWTFTRCKQGFERYYLLNG